MPTFGPPVQAIANFTTGPASVPDVGTVTYNGCIFSPLFETNLSGNATKDNAQRTVKWVDYTLTVDGYVTLPAGAQSINATCTTLKNLLTAQAGSLIYQGRSIDLIVNAVGGPTLDAAWGPVPELLEFQPLGGGLSAKVRWVCKVRVPPSMPGIKGGTVGRINVAATPLLQLNYETSVAYAEDGYSSLSIRGTMEIALTRTPSQSTRTLTSTVDDVRSRIEAITTAGIDLSRFRVTRRNFDVSRDKRTMEWAFECEEKPYMDLPPDCTVARGTYSFRPARAGMGLCNWLCTLRCTYTVAAGRPRRVAWFAFLALLRERMRYSTRSGTVANPNPLIGVPQWTAPSYTTPDKTVAFWNQLLKAQLKVIPTNAVGGNNNTNRTAWLMDFSGEEGVYLDSKTTGFSATWRIVTVFSNILQANGMWRKVQENDAQSNNLWATSVKDVSATQSWLPNKLDPKLDVIVDFGL